MWRLSGERAEAKRRHWSAVAASASEQCGRARVTGVHEVRSLASWLASDAVAGATCKWVLSFDPSATPLATVTRDAAAKSRDSIVVLSGPEGGLSGDEERAAVARGFVRVSLGPRVLRADTAPLALLAWLGLATTTR